VMRTRAFQVLLLTGTCGSGKSTVAALIAQRPGWTRTSEDEIWLRRFGRDRGAFGTDNHRRKRAVVHQDVLAVAVAAIRQHQRVVVDATIHEAPPEALEEYRELLRDADLTWRLRVLHPRVEVAIARDARRVTGSLGAARVAALHAKFTGRAFPADWFVDTSGDSPAETVARVLGTSG
jgi:predicted kinase